MKIDGNEPVPTPAIQQRSPLRGRESGKDFGSVLSDTVARSSHARLQPQASAGLSSVTIAGAVATIEPDSGLLLKRVENLLDTLDGYRQKLADSRYTLRDLYPDVQRLSRQSQDLMPILDSLSQNDDLKDVLNRTLMTASLEMIRFHRGDYITT